MARPTFQDIIPPDKRSIKKISIPSRGREIDRVDEERVERTDRAEKQYEPPQNPNNSKRLSGRTIFIIVGLIIIVGAAGLSVIISMYRGESAVLVVTPKSQTIQVSGSFVASQNITDPIQFQTVSMVRDGKLSLPATGQQTANIKASGTITVYNNYSKTPQKLVANTRFQSPQGYIFRISNNVTVPGMYLQGGKLVPGSIDATVTADTAGSDYNVGLTDFTIPGFKGDPQYSKFYARSKTPIAGGLVGAENIIDDTETQNARAKIDSELQKDLISEIQSDIPAGFVLPGNAYSIQYSDLPNVSTGSNVTVSEEATFNGLIFNSSELAGAVSVNSSLSGMNLNVGDSSGLTFTFAKNLKNSTTTQVWQQPTVSFSLQGTTTVVSVLDPEKIKSDLAGKPRKDLNAILAGYPGIENASVTLKPFWNQTFPENTAKINVIIATTTN